MEVKILQDNLVPNGTFSEVTLYKSIKSDTILYKNSNGVILPVGSGGGQVYYGLTATGTSAASTKTTLNYGINVITTVTSNNYAAKLPMPITGQTVIVVNNSGMILSLYPSMLGGSINNTINSVASIPSDGKPYNFFCIENPLPGQWTWSNPATTQYLSDIITIPSIVSGGTTSTNPIFSIYNSTNYVNRGTSWGALSEAEDGKNKLPVVSNSSGVYFKFNPFASNISKLKVWTNLLGRSTINIAGSLGACYYDIATGALEGIKYIVSGNLSQYEETTSVIPGTPVGTYVSANIGDAGTRYGSITLPAGLANSGGLIQPIVGDKYLGQEINPNTGNLCDVWTTGYLNIEVKPLSQVANYGTITGVKFQFAVEYY